MSGRGGKILKTVMDNSALNNSIVEIARSVAEDTSAMRKNRLCIVGIKTMGDAVARRMAGILSELTGNPVPLGVLDITLYRDDIGRRRKLPKAGETEMPFSVDGLDVLLVDDVISTGRTARAAMESVMDYGRPARIKLAAVADRGGREFPIQPDYCAVKVSAGKSHKVVVVFDGKKGEKQGVFIKET